MRKKKILMMLALLLTAVTGAWADEVTTQCTVVFTGFTATAGSNTGDGGYAKLVDGNTATKWCTNTSPFYIEFHSSAPFVPTGYIMTTGGDTQSYSGRNPKSWTIKAKAHAEDDWTTLVTVENDATMPAKNYEPVLFAISGNATAYQYFRLDVSATRGDSWFQLSEFQFTGTSYECTDGVFTGFTATAGAGSAGPGNGGYTKLVDGRTDTKWLTTSSPFYIEFHSSAPFVPTGYIMTTAEDAASYSGRNPKSWTIKAKVNADDAEWTTLATVTDDTTMPAENNKAVHFAFDVNNTTVYQYFRLDVSAIQSGNMIQLSEFQFTGTSYDISYATVAGVYSLYTVSPTPSITPVVTIPGQTTLTFGTDYTATLDGVAVASLPISISETGDYTLTLTGTGSYAGTKSINFRVVGPGYTEDYPITIGSTDDWNTFASNVSGGNSYSGKFVKLTSNISVSTMVGTSEANSFQGTFLGGGHTLTFTKGSSESAFGEENCAPFRYTKDATIRDLNVAGDIYTSKKFAAGIVARPNGTTNITNCHVSTVIHSSVSADGGDGTHGGFTAYPQGNVNFTGCVYTGRMFTTTGSTKCGGFVGWHNNQTYTFVNSLYAPDPNITAAANETAIITDCATFVRGGSAGTGCYYTETMGEAQGTPAYTSAPADEVSKQVTVNATTYYMPCTVSCVLASYHVSEAANITPVVAYGNTTLTFGTDFTATLNTNDVAALPISITVKGDYTLTLTGTGDYAGAKTISFEVLNDNEINNTQTTLTTGEYVVSKDVNFSSRITISGDVVLNLAEGATLNARKGIELSQGNSLTINGPGALTINGCDYGKSGIGAYQVGTLTINGGIINVISGRHAAGIGGDSNNTVGGTITINGGVVNASSHSEGFGAGIGGGRNTMENGAYGVCGDIIINGGQVTAIGGYDDANNQYAQGIGVGMVYWSCQSAHLSGSLTLSWSSPDDFVYSSSFASVYMGSSIGSITIADGKQFSVEGLDTPIDNTTENLADIISGKVICGYNYVGSITLTDDAPYRRILNISLTSATYRKTLDETRVGKYQAWLVPFDYTIKAADLEKFKFYKINMIANSPDPSVNATDQMWVFLKQMSAGDVLHANMPYVYKAKEAVTDYDFTTKNTVMMARNTGVIAETRTMEDIYSFYATYENTKATEADPFYYVNINGDLSLGDAVTVGAFRWIIRVESKFGTPNVSYAREMHFFDGEENTTGVVEAEANSSLFTLHSLLSEWFTLDGRKLDCKPTAKGIYVHGGRKTVVK